MPVTTGFWVPTLIALHVCVARLSHAASVVHVESEAGAANGLRITMPAARSRPVPFDGLSTRSERLQGCGGIVDPDTGLCLGTISDAEMNDPCWPGTVVQGATSVSGGVLCKDCPNGSVLPGCIVIEYDCGHGTLNSATGSCACNPGWTISTLTDQCSVYTPAATANSVGSVAITSSPMLAASDGSGQTIDEDTGLPKPTVRITAPPQPLWQRRDTAFSVIAFSLVGVWFIFAKRTDLF